MEKASLSEANAIFLSLHKAGKYAEADRPSTAGSPTIGYFCTYFPVEILHAAGMSYIRVTGDIHEPVHVETHLPSFGCSFARSSLELALSGALDHLQGVAFAHTCDTIQVLADVWRNLFPDKFCADLMIPNRLDGPAATTCFANELRRFVENIHNHFNVDISSDALWQSIHLYNKRRKLLDRLYQWRWRYPGVFSADKFFYAVNSNACMERTAYCQTLQDLLDQLEQLNIDALPGRNGVRVFVIGNICNNPQLLNIIEDSNCIIVDDDICTGARSFRISKPNILSGGSHNDPYTHLAGIYLLKASCPVKIDLQRQRATAILERIKKSRAQGVIFIMLRLCDPHCFDYTPLRKAIENQGYPTLLIEYDLHTTSFQQIQTRIEAFAEILGNY